MFGFSIVKTSELNSLRNLKADMPHINREVKKLNKELQASKALGSELLRRKEELLENCAKVRSTWSRYYKLMTERNSPTVRRQWREKLDQLVNTLK